MTPFLSLLVCLVGFLVAVAGMTLCRTQYRSRVWMLVGLMIIGVGFVGGSVYDDRQAQKSKDDIAARTVVISGVVYHSAPQVGLKGCSLVLEELPNVTFILPEKDTYGRSCADVKLGDTVDVKFVQPKKKAESNRSMEYIEALDFFDRTNVDPPYPPKTPTRE